MLELVRDRLGLHGVRCLAKQAEHDATVGAMALASRAERAIEFDLDRCGGRQQEVALQALREQQCGAHRADRVRA